jgi:hypothetical protein
MGRTDSLPSKWLAVGRYEWEVHYTLSLVNDGGYWIAFRLVLIAFVDRSRVDLGGIKLELGVTERYSGGGEVKVTDHPRGWRRIQP